MHEADEQGQPRPAEDGPNIQVIRQYHRQGNVNAYQSLYREAVSLMTQDPGDAAEGKFVLIDDEYWYISSPQPGGLGLDPPQRQPGELLMTMTETTAEAQRRLNLLPKELDRAVTRARRRAIGAGRARAFRQMKRITGEGREYWLAEPRVRRPLQIDGSGEGLGRTEPVQDEGRTAPAVPGAAQGIRRRADRRA